MPLSLSHLPSQTQNFLDAAHEACCYEYEKGKIYLIRRRDGCQIVLSARDQLVTREEDKDFGDKKKPVPDERTN